MPSEISQQQLYQQLTIALGETSQQELLMWFTQAQIVEPVPIKQFWLSTDTRAGMYLIVSGKVRLLDSAENLITTVGAGSVFGEATLFAQQDFVPYAARASSKIKLCYLKQEILQVLMDRYTNTRIYLCKKAQLGDLLMVYRQNSQAECQSSDLPAITHWERKHYPKQTVAVVGRSVSGKTTLSKLILGLYPPTEGKVLIDGQDVSNISLKSLRSQIGVVDQDNFLSGGTIRENISIAHPEASIEEIIEAAHLAGADEFIQQLPMGYETQIGEGGEMLSGGQRQRLAIARALLGNPRFLIFDEATSNLDAESERIIQNNLKTILTGRTSLIIAHRLVQARSDISQAQERLKEQQSTYEKILHHAKSEIQQAELRLQEQRNYQSLVHTGQLAQLKAEEQLKQLQTQIKSLQSEIAQTGSQITSLKIQLRQRVVRSLINGAIFELPITKPGAALQPSQRLAQIVPQGVGLVLKASMPNQESGFLKVSMPIKVKLDAYPFQEYGIVQGKVNRISPDSKVTQIPQGNIESFELEIALNQPYVQNGDKRIALTPGQMATAEVIVRQRRLIDYILDPFKKLQKSGLDL